MINTKNRSIIARLEELERKNGLTLPVVNAEYQSGETVKYNGLPPMKHLFRDENPIVKTFGSEFADLVNALIHPLPNREFSDFEEMENKEKQD